MMSDGTERGPIHDSLPILILIPSSYVGGGLGWRTFCGAIVCSAASLNPENLVLHPPLADARRPPPMMGEGERKELQAQERDYFLAELLQLRGSFGWMCDGVDSDVAGAGFDVLANLCSYVGGAAERAVAFRCVVHIGCVPLAQEFSRDCVCGLDALAQPAEYLDAGAELRNFAACAFRFLADEIEAVSESLWASRRRASIRRQIARRASADLRRGRRSRLEGRREFSASAAC
jgi:hypothetical protein